VTTHDTSFQVEVCRWLLACVRNSCSWERWCKDARAWLGANHGSQRKLVHICTCAEESPGAYEGDSYCGRCGVPRCVDAATSRIPHTAYGAYEGTGSFTLKCDIVIVKSRVTHGVFLHHVVARSLSVVCAMPGGCIPDVLPLSSMQSLYPFAMVLALDQIPSDTIQIPTQLSAYYTCST
jgi:hypothetical protein